ncbi:recombinase family protein [Streptomyces sp. NPDC002187]|uniref:recombinase family protein n=1 Tax=Streptomyces sp. NPDC002187 TaxID=3364637 RepID=UPI0036888B4D
MTAAKPEVIRPAFRQMCSDIIHGQEEETGLPVHGCVAVEWERVYRLPRDCVAFQDALFMNADGVFIAGDVRLGTVDGDGATLTGVPAPGAMESEVASTRIRAKRSAADRAEEGKTCGAPRRFGWLGASRDPFRVGNKHRNPDEWPHLIDMIKMRHAGRSWRSITAEMNKRGVRTARGGSWSERGVKILVTNPAWWGGRLLHGELVRSVETGEPAIGDWDRAESADECTYEMWQKIVTGTRVKSVQQRMTPGHGNQPSGRATRTEKCKFSGYLLCGRINELGEVCFSKLSGNKATGRNAKYGAYYRCGDPN